MKATKRTLGVKEIADLLTVSTRTVMKWYDSGMFPSSYRLPTVGRRAGSRRILLTDLLDFCRRHRLPLPPKLESLAVPLVYAAGYSLPDMGDALSPHYDHWFMEDVRSWSRDGRLRLKEWSGPNGLWQLAFSYSQDRPVAVLLFADAGDWRPVIALADRLVSGSETRVAVLHPPGVTDAAERLGPLTGLLSWFGPSSSSWSTVSAVVLAEPLPARLVRSGR